MNPLNKSEDSASQQNIPQNSLRKAQKGGRVWQDGRNQEALHKVPLNLRPKDLKRYAAKTETRYPLIDVKGVGVSVKEILGDLNYFIHDEINDKVVRDIFVNNSKAQILRFNSNGTLEFLWHDPKYGLMKEEFTANALGEDWDASGFIDEINRCFNDINLAGTVINKEELKYCFFERNKTLAALKEQNINAFAIRTGVSVPGSLIIEQMNVNEKGEKIIQDPMQVLKCSKDPDLPVLYQFEDRQLTLEQIKSVCEEIGLVFVPPTFVLPTLKVRLASLDYFFNEKMSTHELTNALKAFPAGMILKFKSDEILESFWFDKESGKVRFDASKNITEDYLIKNILNKPGKTVLNKDLVKYCFLSENRTHEILNKQNTNSFAIRMSGSAPGSLVVEMVSVDKNRKKVIQQPTIITKCTKDPETPVLYQVFEKQLTIQQVIDFYEKQGLTFLFPR